MDNKKVSDTIKQQKKSRQDFLALKKMQAGEMAPEPKPSEIAVSPRTFKEKLQNFWFHFKWQTLGIIFAVVVLAVTVSQCASKTDWDMQVVYFTYNIVIDDQTNAIGDYLENIAEDINGDGEININVINCSVPDGNHKSQYNKSMLMKLQAMITAEPKAMLYITDNESIEYFEADALKNFFGSEQLVLGDDFYEKTKTETFGQLPKGLQIACRRVSGTTLEKNKTANQIHSSAMRILEKLEKPE